MELSVGAKGTKPGSKATAKRSQLNNGKPPRVPVGTLHVIDVAAQPPAASMYDAVCGERGLTIIDGSWDDDHPNDRCEQCSDRQWAESFNESQQALLP